MNKTSMSKTRLNLVFCMALLQAGGGSKVYSLNTDGSQGDQNEND